MIQNYIEMEQKSLKTFLSFILIIILILFPSYTLFSDKFIVKNVNVISDFDIETSITESFYGKSIWFVTDKSLSKYQDKFPYIEKIETERFLPSTVQITFKSYSQIAKIKDLRGSQPKETVLYKNLFRSNDFIENNDLLQVSIINGPVDEAFDGELVSFFMTIQNFEGINIGGISLIHIGNTISGYYEDVEILFGAPVDLSKKAAAIGELLASGECSGTVTFVNSESFITECNI